MELDQSPKVVNILVFQDHSIKHIMAYVTPNQIAKTVAKFLYQGYILISGALAKLFSDQEVELYEQHYLGVVQGHGDLEDRGIHPTVLKPRGRWNV